MGKTRERKMLEKLKESEEQYRIFASYQQVVPELRMFYLKDAHVGKIIQMVIQIFRTIWSNALKNAPLNWLWQMICLSRK